MKKLYYILKLKGLLYMNENDLSEADVVRSIEQLMIVGIMSLLCLLVLYGFAMAVVA